MDFKSNTKYIGYCPLYNWENNNAIIIFKYTEESSYEYFNKEYYRFYKIKILEMFTLDKENNNIQNLVDTRYSIDISYPKRYSKSLHNKLIIDNF